MNPAADHPTPGQSGRLLLGLLFVVALFNYADRYMLGILIPDIKAELALSDSQIGFMTGIAFTVFYATLGLPIARLADSYSRRKIITAALGLWSAMTAVCGLAQSFVQLTIARVLVGVGEAGSTPPSHSIIADAFPKSKRAKALAIYALGSPSGLLVGFLIGGWLTANYGWRTALFAFGIPGALFAIVVFFKLREPRRGQSDGVVVDDARPGFWEVFRLLLGRASFRHCVLGVAVHGIVYIGLITWIPSFFARTHDLGIAEIGAWLAAVLGLSQLAGIYVGGVLGDRFGSKNPQWYLWIAGYGVLISAPFFVAVFLSSVPTIALLALAIPFFFAVMQAGPSYAVIQGVSGPRMRAMGSAINILIINLIGGGLGPQIIGSASDLLTPRYGDDGLRYALLGTSVFFSTWAWVHFALAARTVRADFAAATA